MNDQTIEIEKFMESMDFEIRKKGKSSSIIGVTNKMRPLKKDINKERNNMRSLKYRITNAKNKDAKKASEDAYQLTVSRKKQLEAKLYTLNMKREYYRGNLKNVKIIKRINAGSYRFSLASYLKAKNKDSFLYKKDASFYKARIKALGPDHKSVKGLKSLLAIVSSKAIQAGETKKEQKKIYKSFKNDGSFEPDLVDAYESYLMDSDISIYNDLDEEQEEEENPMGTLSEYPEEVSSNVYNGSLMLSVNYNS